MKLAGIAVSTGAIALGLIAFLALMLAAEGGSSCGWPTASPGRCRHAHHDDSPARRVGPRHRTHRRRLDLEVYLREQFGQVLQPFVVIMRDGQIVTNHDDVPRGCSRRYAPSSNSCNRTARAGSAARRVEGDWDGTPQTGTPTWPEGRGTAAAETR